MRFSIVGSGAVGGYYGAKLAHAGHEVTFIARGDHLRAIRDRGLTVKSGLGDFTVRARAEDRPENVPPADVAESTPFGAQPLVFKVGGRMFALVGYLHGQPVVSLKCDPEQGVMLRATFPTVTPGYHLNKEHWSTVPLDGSVPRALVFELVDDAYELVAAATRRPAKKRAARKR